MTVSLPCPQCNGTGWNLAGFRGLGMDVMVINKEGEFQQIVCSKCRGSGLLGY